MSHQPSTREQYADKASTAIDSVANKLTSSADEDGDYDPNKDTANFKKDIHGNTVKKGDLKDKLNAAAIGERKNAAAAAEPPPTLAEKIKSYIPGLGSSEVATKEENDLSKETNAGGPPHRPDHDVQVEQFLRKQYHSKSGDGMPNLDKKD